MGEVWQAGYATTDTTTTAPHEYAQRRQRC
jgi:hypothetical protein